MHYAALRAPLDGAEFVADLKRRLEAEVQRQWGVINLLDVLKNADFLTGFTEELTSVLSREALPEQVLRRRLLLVAFRARDEHGDQARVPRDR